MNTGLYVRFERGRDAVMGLTMGPYGWLQVTYGSLRVPPDGDVIAEQMSDGDWRIVGEGDYRGEFYSDFIITHENSRMTLGKMDPMPPNEINGEYGYAYRARIHHRGSEAPRSRYRQV